MRIKQAEVRDHFDTDVKTYNFGQISLNLKQEFLELGSKWNELLNWVIERRHIWSINSTDLNESRHQELVRSNQEVAIEFRLVRIFWPRELVAVDVVQQGRHHSGRHWQAQGTAFASLNPAPGRKHRPRNI